MDNSTHNIRIENRSRLFADGVSEVISFDEFSVALDTSGGRLNISGDGLHVKTLCLEKGEVSVEGRIDDVIYEDTDRGGKRPFFGRRNK